MFHFDFNSGTIIGVVFWLFITAVCITPMIVGYKMRIAALETLRAAIDKGQDLSPGMIKQLSGIGESMGATEQKVSPVHLKIASMIVMGGGIGAASVATVFLLVPSVAVAAPFIYAGAILIFFIGAGLHFSAKILQQHELEQKSSNPVA